MYEVEKKFPVDDLHPIRQELLKLLEDYSCTQETQLDRYLAHPARDFATTDEACRLRCLNGDYYLTYKGPKKLAVEVRTRREIEIQLGIDDEQAEQLLEMMYCLGFRKVLSVCKQRESFQTRWKNHVIGIALDQVEKLGEFVEIESVVEESGISAAESVVSDFAKRLGLTHSVRTSYLQMLLDRRGHEA